MIISDWKQAEKHVAKLIGRKTPASGSKSSKLDVIGEGIYDGLRAEVKFTDKGSRSISIVELEKTFKQAMQNMCEWCFWIVFSTGLKVVVISEKHFIQHYELIDEQKAEIQKLQNEISKLR